MSAFETYYREPVRDWPEVYITAAFKVECGSTDCKYYEFATSADVATEMLDAHVEWHIDGCPE